LVSYIPFNPARPGLVKTIEELDYPPPLKRHNAVMGKNECLCVDSEYVLLQFDDTKFYSGNGVD
jgi:hypothetical protein